MRCRVLLFAQAADAYGAVEADVDVAHGATINDVLRELCEASARFQQIIDSIACAVDERYVARDHVMQPGEVLAIIPPVSGG